MIEMNANQLAEAHYIGDECAGVYFLAVEHDDKWFALVVVDAEHFTASSPTLGPYDTEAEAHGAGGDRAHEWCLDNSVKPPLL